MNSKPLAWASTTAKSGAQIIVDTLIEEGVDTMFGYTGGVVLPLFDRLYEALTTGITVNQEDRVGPAIEQMLRQDRPCVVDFHVDPEENVLPMAPPGKGPNEMEGLRVLQNAM